jgi:hypothetical protein
MDGGREDVLRGLGYLTVDRAAAAAVQQALRGWVTVQPGELGTPGAPAPLPGVAVPAAYLAVQQYGQRLAYALHGFEAREIAENRELWWHLSVDSIVNLIPGPWGVGAGVVAGYLAIWMNMDGTWENGVDRGLVFDRADAAAEALAQLPPDRSADVVTVARQARAAFDRTARALGLPRPPTSPEVDYLEPVLDGMAGLAAERLGKLARVPR